MSLQTVNDRLLIALNGNGTGQFDPRPAVANFLCSYKQRRYTVNQNWKRTVAAHSFHQKVFPRRSWQFDINRPTLVVLNSEEIVVFLAKVCIFKKLL